MRARLPAAFVLLGAVAMARSARADAAPSPPEACESRPQGARCFDALGRPGRCVAAPYTQGRCSLVQEDGAPSSTAAAAPASTPAGDPRSPPESSGGCATAAGPLVGGGTSVLGVFLLLGARRRRKRG